MAEPLDGLKSSLADRYQFDRELTGGGMSRVFVAHEQSLGRNVVVKVLAPELAGSVNIERFRREVQLAARLQHSHIVPVLTAGEANGLLYYTMPYVEGESLRARIAHLGALPDADVIKILIDVLGALSYAHARGIVHRDIKPENILLSEGGAMLTDFGIAKAVSDAGTAETITGIGMMVGTPAYTAPEQAAGDPNVDHRADIYAVGAVAYEMLCGEQLFGGRPTHLQLVAHITEPPPALATKRPDIAPRLAALIMRCLEKDPQQRPATAKDVMQEVQTIGRMSGVISMAGLSTSRRRMLVAAAAVVLVAILAGAFFVPRDLIAQLRTLANRKPAQLHVNRVVVAPFDNETGDPKLASLGPMAADWIADGLSHLASLEVVDARSAAAAADVVHAIPRLLRKNDQRALADETGSGVIITGTIYRDSTAADGAVIRIQAKVLDATTSQIRQVMPMVSGPVGNPRTVVEALRRQMVASMRASSDTVLSSMPGAYMAPPSLEAYEVTRQALEAYFSNDSTLWALLAKARSIDTSYATPVVFTAFAAVYRARFPLADSALARLAQMRERLTPPEAAMTDHVRALMRADIDSAVRAAQSFVRLQPGSMEAPLLLASTAITARKPEIALAALKLIDPDRGLNLAGPFYWFYLAGANSQLGQTRPALRALEEAAKRFPSHTGVLSARVVTLARNQQIGDAERLIDAFSFRRPIARVRVMALLARVARTTGDEAAAERIVTRELANRSLSSDTTRAGAEARVLLLTASGRRWPELLAATEQLLPRLRPEESWRNIDVRSTRAIALLHVGRRAEALAVDSALATERPAYDYGWTTYMRARIAAHLDRPTDAMALIKRAQTEGLDAMTLAPPYAEDPLLFPLRNQAEYKVLRSKTR